MHRDEPPPGELPIGPPVESPPPGRHPAHRVLAGRTVALEPLRVAAHAADLWDSIAGADPDGALWTYMSVGPFADAAALRRWLESCEGSRDRWHHAIVPAATGRAAGMAAFLRCDAPNGVIEIGFIWLSPGLQRTREATEALFLLMREAFDELGMRRLEWKCNALNAASRRAAVRLGFRFEGVFRQHMIVKGRNRDTAWYAILDRDWPAIRAAFEAWLADDNFDAAGRQRTPLAAQGAASGAGADADPGASSSG